MAKRAKQHHENIDDLDFSYGPGSDDDFFADTFVDELEEDDSGFSARQCIERREEAAWLRSQMVDWDDWDEYFETH